jgi:two-component system, NarL family, nitrate/nitrite response regulator NarL
MTLDAERPVSLFVVFDLRLAREAIAKLLAEQDGIDVVGTAASHDSVLARLDVLKPEVVLLDMGRPEAVPVARAISNAAPDSKVVALGLPESEQEVIACAEAGVAGFLAAESSLEDTLATIASAVVGEMLCTPRMAAVLVRRVATLAAARDPHRDGAQLTARELEIVDLIDRGLSNKEIAQQLHIEVATVKNHVHNILEKLGVRRRSEAAATLRSQGTLRLTPVRRRSAEVHTSAAVGD